MPRLKCPRCATVIDVAPGASPVCPACGFGSGSGSAPSTAVTGPTSPPVQPMMSPPPAGGFSSPPGAYGSPPMGMPAGQQKTSGKAIAALVLGIVSVCLAVYLGVICGIIGLILGIMGMKEVDRNPQTMKGKGMAITGIVLGAVGILFQIVILLIFGLAFATAFECFDDPDAPGCEDFQDPSANVVGSAPATVVGSSWPDSVELAWSHARAWAS